MKRPDLDEMVRAIPDFAALLTVDEMNESSRHLAAQHPSIARLWEVGRSRRGEPLEALVIGSGPRVAVLVGLPHPNEPIGAMTCEYLAGRLCDDRSLGYRQDFTWVILKVADPDGSRLNEGWFRPPFTVNQYLRYFYRPPSHEQVEWTFPVTYKRFRSGPQLPETLALMRIIDELRPAVLFSLHNAAFGGVYWYLSHPLPQLYGELHAAAAGQGLPLARGEPELPYAVEFSTAVYRMPGLADIYDYLEQNGQEPLTARSGGTCSADYARSRYGTRTLVSEVPFFSHPKSDDTRPMGIGRQAAFLASAGWLERFHAEVGELFEQVAPRIPPNPFRSAVESFLVHAPRLAGAQRRWAESSVEPAAQATVAQDFDLRVISRIYRLRILAMLIRALPVDEPERGRAEVMLERHLQDLDSEMGHCRPFPIRKQVAVQVASVLSLVRYLQAAPQ